MAITSLVKTAIKLHWRYHRLKRECSAYVRHNDMRVVGDAMFRLNHIAYHWYGKSRKSAIYDLKNSLVKLWYQRGYAVRVQLQTQTQWCWRCNGSGKEPWQDREVAPGVYEEWCEKCGGDGIFRQHKLYAFNFVVDGKHFSWHQPANLIDYAVAVTIEDVTEFERHDNSEVVVLDLTSDQAEVDYCTVLEYLRWQGSPAPHELITLKRTWNDMWWRTGYAYRWREFKRKFRNRFHIRPQHFEEIPF